MLDKTSPMSIAFYSMDTPFYNEVASNRELLSIAEELSKYLSRQSKITLEDLDEFDMNAKPDPLAKYGRKDKHTTKGRPKGSKNTPKPTNPQVQYFSDPSPIGKPNTVSVTSSYATVFDAAVKKRNQAQRQLAELMPAKKRKREIVPLIWPD